MNNSGKFQHTALVLQLGSTAVGIRTDEGVVLAVEKRITSPLLVRISKKHMMDQRRLQDVSTDGTPVPCRNQAALKR